MTRPPELIKRLSADDLYEDKAGDIWMLAYSPIVGLVKYERGTGRVTEYPLGGSAARAGQQQTSQ